LILACAFFEPREKFAEIRAAQNATTDDDGVDGRRVPDVGQGIRGENHKVRELAGFQAAELVFST
jgi:hypothetical protein